MAKLDSYLKKALEHRASDLHFSSGEPTRVRVDGELVVLEPGVLDGKEIQEIFFEIFSDGEKQKFLTSKNLDRSYAAPGVGNFRVNVFNTRRGPAAVLRAIPTKTPSLADLGLPAVVEKLCNRDKGLILITGPTGSGKSTTLAAMINYINENFNSHILTVEDPIEFVHESKKSLVNQREIGGSCLSFADALKYALREDPDVILIGEMRDLETISLALTAAETGHLVLGTLHTRGAGPSVDRIIDSFPANQQAMIRTMLAESLVAVISQALIKRASGEGRAAAYEIMVVNHAISNLMREGKTFQIASIMQTARKEGNQLLDQSLLELVTNKVVTPEDAALYMENPTLLGGKFANPSRLMAFAGEKVDKDTGSFDGESSLNMKTKTPGFGIVTPKNPLEKTIPPRSTTPAANAPMTGSASVPSMSAKPSLTANSPLGSRPSAPPSIPVKPPVRPPVGAVGAEVGVPPVLPPPTQKRPVPPPGPTPVARKPISTPNAVPIAPPSASAPRFAPLGLGDETKQEQIKKMAEHASKPPPPAVASMARKPLPPAAIIAEVSLESLGDKDEEILIENPSSKKLDTVEDFSMSGIQELDAELKNFLGDDVGSESPEEEVVTPSPTKRKIG